MIGELTVEYKLPLATGTYWDIAAKSIASLLEKQKALLHACEAETSMIMAMAPELVNPEELSQMHGPYIPGLSAIPGVNEGVYRWRQLSSRSPIGVIGDAGTASAAKGEKLIEAISATWPRRSATNACGVNRFEHACKKDRLRGGEPSRRRHRPLRRRQGHRLRAGAALGAPLGLRLDSDPDRAHQERRRTECHDAGRQPRR